MNITELQWKSKEEFDSKINSLLFNYQLILLHNNSYIIIVDLDYYKEFHLNNVSNIVIAIAIIHNISDIVKEFTINLKREKAIKEFKNICIVSGFDNNILNVFIKGYDEALKNI